MKIVLLIPAVLLIAFGSLAYSQIPESFEQAKNMAAEQEKPVLMEFLRPG